MADITKTKLLALVFRYTAKAPNKRSEEMQIVQKASRVVKLPMGASRLAPSISDRANIRRSLRLIKTAATIST
jgi:hypothetical protein